LIDWLLRFSVRGRVLVLVLTALFVLVGASVATTVPIDAIPDVTNVQVQVITAAPALGPVDVETYVTYPVEQSMAGLPKVEEIRSMSRPGISVVTVVFHDDVDLYFARRLVAERLTEARQSIPPGYGNPELGPISSGLGEVFHFEVRGEGKTPMELRTVLDWQIAPRLKLVPGVVEVNTFGGEAKTLELTLDPARLAAERVGVDDVVKAIERNHFAVGGAYMVDGREQMTIRGEARLRTPDDLGSVVVVEARAGPGAGSDSGAGERAPLYLRDLGVAHFAPRVRYGAVTRDGRGEAVVGVVMLLMGENSGEVIANIKEAVADVSKSLPEGVTIDPYYDRTDLVKRTIGTVTSNLVEASVLVVVVLFLTLASLRAGSVVALAIPLAMLGVFIGMRLTGVSGNLLSLGAIDFGLVVDGAIIIVENAVRRMAERREALGRVLTGEERQAEVLEAAREVRGATAFGEAIIALVYVPLLALESVEGRMFRPMALTVLFALGSAFVLSLTVVPAVASLLLARDAHDRHSPIVRLAMYLYRPSLAAALRSPRIVAGVTLALFACSIAGGTRMGQEFLPKLDEGTLVIAAVRLPSVSLEQSMEQARQVELLLRKFPEVTSVVSRTGRAEIAIDPMGINMSDIYVLLKPKAEWTTAHDREGLVQALDKALSEGVPGLGFAFSQPIEMNTNDLLAGISSDVAIHVYGHDLVALKLVSEKIVRVLRQVPGAADVRAEQIAGLSVLTVRIDRTMIARYGLDAQTVMATVEALGGTEVGSVVDGAERFPIQVRLNESARRSPEAIAALPVRTPSGAIVPLGQLAHVEIAPGPPQVGRERLARRVTVQANVRGRDIGSFVQQAQADIEKTVKLPTGYALAWAGEYERLQGATKRLLVVVPVTLTLIIVLLVVTFGELRPALLIFLNVPMSISGGLAALYLRSMPLSIAAAVGFIALFGVAVLNGLVLVSSMERLRKAGLPIKDVVLQGAEGRLRPVLTTALVASLGFIPMALATGAGAEVQRPLSTVVIGGLVSSTLLTLLVLPAVYGLVTRALPGEPTPPASREPGEADAPPDPPDLSTPV
jgi:heavy metal efflux system protein